MNMEMACGGDPLVMTGRRARAYGPSDVGRVREISWMPRANVLAEVERILHTLNVPAAGREYIDSCIRLGPSRQVSNDGGNTRVWYHCRKTGATLDLESRKGELPTAILLDEDPRVVCVLAQPQGVRLAVADSSGRVRGSPALYRGDFLVVRRDWVGVVQSRQLTRIANDALRNPHQWYMDDANAWHYRAADQAFHSIGLGHELLANESLPATTVRNARFLEDYLHESCPILDKARAAEIRAFVQEARQISFIDALRDGGFTADELNIAIATGLVYVDLTTDLLDDTAQLVLFSDPALHKAYRTAAQANAEPPLRIPGTIFLRTGGALTFGGKTFTVGLVGAWDVSLTDGEGTTTAIQLAALEDLDGAGLLGGDALIRIEDPRQLHTLNSGQLHRAMERRDAIEAPEGSRFTPGTVAGFKRQIQGVASPIEQLVALADDVPNRGNRTRRVSAINLAAAAVALEKFNTPEAPNAKAAYHIYVLECAKRKEESGLPVVPVSYPTFCKWCRQAEDIKKRKGKRHAYQAEEIPTRLDNAHPVHGVRPDEVCYIDHTCLNIATQTPLGVQLDKPWFSVARDGHTTNARAHYISYDAPSAAVVLMVLRDYIRRNNRLPKILSVDGGREFSSRALKFFCWLYKIELRLRPPGRPRCGAPIESLIGATEIEILAQAQGNTRVMKDARMVTKSVDPFNRAIWTLSAVYHCFDYYLYEIRPNRIHPVLGMTPKEYERRRWLETGRREHVMVKLDQDVMLYTSPHAAKPMHKVQQRGVWVSGFYYNDTRLKPLRDAGKTVEVRVEPWCHFVVYVSSNGSDGPWIAAVCSNPRRLGNLTRREMEIAWREQSRRAGVAANKDTVTPEAAQNMSFTWAPENFDARIAAQQHEMRFLYQPLKLTTAMDLGDLDRLPGSFDVIEARDALYVQEDTGELQAATADAQTAGQIGTPASPPPLADAAESEPARPKLESESESESEDEDSDLANPPDSERYPGYY
jgi:putative transposase